MDTEALYYLLALQKVKNIGDISAKKLLRHFGSAKAIFEAAKRNDIDVQDIGSVMIQSLRQFDQWQKVSDELKYIEQNRIKAVTIFDNEYPYRLQHAPDGPVLFFYQGNVDLNSPKMLSIVGTRNITAYGKRVVAGFMEVLAPYKPVIVSGLAYGVDVEAHFNALKHDLPTIAVLGHGFQRIYPSVHQKIARQMLDKGGLITEFWHTDPVDRNNFLKRNRIIAGISEAVLVVESGEKGGALVTADIANSYNRDVFAVPGRIFDNFSMGCNNLIKNNKAALVTRAEDIINMLRWTEDKVKPASPQLNLFVDLTDDEQLIFDLLQAESKLSLDEIAVMLQMPVSKTAQVLLQMELKNIIASLPGKMYELL